MDRHFKSLGVKPVVANPAKLPTITKSNHKNDKRDAHAASKDKTRDSDMKAKYMRIAGDGSSGIAKKKAYVAVARKLAVTMLALLKKPGNEYVPLSGKCREELERMRAEIAYRTMSKVA